MSYPDCHDQVWDPVRAEASGVLDHMHNFPKCNMKEAATVALHELNNDTSELEDNLPDTQPTDGSDWTAEEKAKFRSEIFRCRKNQSAVSKARNNKINSRMTHCFTIAS